MTRHNAENERVKRLYLTWLREAHGRSEATVDAAAAAIDRFQEHTRRKSFATFRREQAISFKHHMAEQRNPATGKPLSKSTLQSTAKALRAFFEWLSRERGYRKIQHADATYFNLTDNDARIASASRDRPAPTVDQVIRAIDAMPASTVLERRDRAVVAFSLLTAARDAAVVSARLKHVDLVGERFVQDAREVRTKRAKTFATIFYPVGDNVKQIVAAWLAELRDEHGFGPDDPVFPSSRMDLDQDRQFAAVGLAREPWASATPVREIFRRAFAAVGLPYFNPHSLRKTIVRLGYDLNLSAQELKAWSEGLGHDSVHTTLGSYGSLSDDERADTMRAIARRRNAEGDDPDELIRRLAAVIAKRRK